MSKSWPDYTLSTRPDLDQVRRQAKELLKAFRAGEPEAAALFTTHLPGADPASAKLADAQHVIARINQVKNWERVVQACQLTRAIRDDDLITVRRLIADHPNLLHEPALGRPSNWGPPMSYAANLGRTRIIEALYDMGAKDLPKALDRAVLQTRIELARLIHRLMGSPKAPTQLLVNAAYTLSVEGTAFALEIGAPVVDDKGRRLVPVDMALETDSRNPAAKKAILEMYVAHGLVLPDTAPMAVHRGRIDLLEAHLARDPGLLTRTFAFAEIYPPDLGCHDEVMATHGTPLGGATLLHMAIDYDEMAIVEWLLAKGMPVDTRAAVDRDGFGGHTALFSTVVAQPNARMNQHKGPYVAPMTQLLLDHGADPNARASLRKQMHPGYDTDNLCHEYRDVTPLGWGQRFFFRGLVSEPAMALIKAAGGGV
jgi:hypothetical protein